MPVHFVISEQTDYVHVLVTGPFDARVSRQGVDEAYALCEARGLGRVLIDGRGITSAVSVADRHDLGAYLVTQRRTPLRVAFIVSEALNITKALENTANNRGLPVITTASESEAHEWLGLPPP